MSAFREVYYRSGDGLSLFARDYENDQSPLTLLCMPGLSRNSADFHDLCAALNDTWRVIAADQRGRGRSEWDRDVSHYVPATYVGDMFLLLAHLDLEPSNVVLVGTSLGGLMAMMMNAMRPGEFAGVIMNDVGPVVDQRGLDRIKSHVGKAPPVTSWEEAVAQAKQSNGAAFPDLPTDAWEKFARNMYAENKDGVPVLLYDPAISVPMDEGDANAVPPDLWPVFDLLADTPLMVIRGEISDILSAECLDEMRARRPDLKVLEVARVGHAPILDEVGVTPAIREFLSGIS